MAKQPSRPDPKPGDSQPATTIGDGKIAYEIIPPAPPRIALQRIEEGQTEIRLTEEQARAEVLAGHIRPKMPAAASASDGV